MSHEQQLNALKIIVDTLSLGRETSILEIGSYDVNGSIREVFSCDSHIGVDLIPGPGVDLVAGGHEIRLDKKFDVVVSSEVFEHNPFWRETLDNMIAHANKDGFVVVTCATTGRLEHGTRRTNVSDSPGTSAKGWDYYHNISQDEMLSYLSERSIKNYILVTQNRTYDLYLIITVGSKDLPQALNEKLKNVSRISWSLGGLVRELWMLFPRALMLFNPPENIYLNICVAYEKYTKFLFRRILFHIRKSLQA